MKFFNFLVLFLFLSIFCKSYANDHDEVLDYLNGSNEYYQKRIENISSINEKSKFNHFSFHLSNPISVFIRNNILKFLSKNKTFLENYLGKIYRT